MPMTAPASLLIVEDEATQLTALCRALTQQGYETIGVSSGPEALEALHGRAFDVLLTDLKMPGMDGIAVLRGALAIDPRLVGIIMTGEGTIATAVEAMQVGALDYILKPVKLSAVVPVLRRALAVRELRLENERLARSVRERTAELEAANRELDAFTYSVSHDLRAPLRAVNGFAQILASDHRAVLPPEAHELIDDILRAARRAEQLIEDLLRFARLGRQALIREPVDVAAIVNAVVQELTMNETGRPIALRVGDLPVVDADRSLLYQAFANLLSNSLKFTQGRAPARIDVGCRAIDGEQVFFVRDNGVGFDMKYASRLFGVFERLHTQEQFAGTGVGLSLVQRIVHRHGGRIWAEAAVDSGATFYFTLGDADVTGEHTAR
jgi:signal transduction histidine kinase